ncbi:MAG: sulfide/dihydroorotate dehydrogenase-like FAD/NAD-binding protein [Candidatus Aadella gelida]|nr:sulfide/dihydroorotate dehydrogenase-like FAD/NAD-binding protein [Candidatus Aadella gelida]
MHKIIYKERLNPEICLLKFEAKDLAAASKAGQFIIIRIDEEGERFPLTMYDWDASEGSVTVVCQAIGVSTKKLCSLNEGDHVLDLAGPLGHSTDTKDIGRVLCIGGGVGTAEAYPIAKAMHEAGNEVEVIIGARTKDLVICEKEIGEFCDKVHVTTDDGTHGRKGFVTDVLKELLDKGDYDLVFAIGPVIMMKMVSEMTRPKKVKTLVSLNSIMIDGTGMCGGCRIKYGSESKFTCVDGPEFDGHKVDFDDLMTRTGQYKDKESIALTRHEHTCRIGLGKQED